MELGVGNILEGKVTGITKFGAFVSLEGNKSGLVHISEIANSYVNDIHDHLKEGQDVKVKIIAIDENGRINLSIKRALPQDQQQGSFQRRDNSGAPQQRSFRQGGNGGGAPRSGGFGGNGGGAPRSGGFGGNGGGAPRSGGFQRRNFGNAPSQSTVPQSADDLFEAKLKQFMSDSEGKISDLNHYMDKRGGRRRK